IRVKCFDKTGSHLYSNLHAFTPRNLTREKHLHKLMENHKHENKPAEILSVLVIGIDSLSRSNHIRSMPKTRHFLLRNLSAVDLKGYNKVAHNTYVNMTPLLTGNFVAVENEKRGITNEKGPFDKYHLIWKNFSSHGYTTMMSEDAPNIATFNYQKKGFAKPPTHHYLRPFSLSIDKVSGVSWKSSRCVSNRSETKLVLDYAKDFVKTYKDLPYFAWSFISRMTHDDPKNAAYIDDDYFEFLKDVQKEGLLNNTILFFISDHGVMYGDILKTEIGQKELRMPLMNIVFPTWFRRKYPAVYGNVVQNANKLTSPFDIHETLKDILYFSGTPRKVVNTDKAGISLFDPIPGSRTCSQASIVPHYCVCDSEEIPIDDQLSNKSITFLVEQINLKISKHSMCAKRILKSVRYVKGYRSLGHAAITLIKSYFILTPDNAEYEATMEHDIRKPGFRLGGAISRANRYGNTADCINISNLRPFCYC
ncbi:hypothetical protein LOTGIDRAFT_93664, partial [Lottia gigantea]